MVEVKDVRSGVRAVAGAGESTSLQLARKLRDFGEESSISGLVAAANDLARAIESGADFTIELGQAATHLALGVPNFVPRSRIESDDLKHVRARDLGLVAQLLAEIAAELRRNAVAA